MFTPKTCLASFVLQPAFSTRTSSLIRLELISLSSPDVMRSTMFLSRGLTVNQTRLCLFGLLPMKGPTSLWIVSL